MAAPPVPVALPPSPQTLWLADAIRAGGGEVVGLTDAHAAVWGLDGDPAALHAALDAHPGIAWVQLPWAGIEPFAGVIAAHPERRWTASKALFAEPVAEMALTLGLAGLRGLGRYTRATGWTAATDATLFDRRATILGGGGIAQALVKLLAPWRAAVTVVRRHPAPMDGVARVVGDDGLHDALPDADLVVLALPVTPQTVGIIGARELALMAPHAWLVNVARGVHVVTDDLVDALDRGEIGGAALDVTDPEPLPEGHPLWSRSNCIITPHTANTLNGSVGVLSARVQENVRRFRVGEPLLGLIDPTLGY